MKKSNQERLEEYLVGNEKSYLKSDISNGKVIMLSGKWGSGKTFFWKEIIEKNLKKEKIPNNYISLYGKTSIQEIKNEVFLKIFESMDIFKIDDKSFGLAKDTANLITDITKSVSVFGFNLDLSKIVDKSFEKLEKVKEEKKEKDIKNTLNSGAIICFDDFERKSKDIDLNDLFGFITNLTIEFDCKVVIILNDDVFEGEEKKIFSNVKEKSVSKFLKYEPKIEELFNLIFDLEIEKDNKKQKKYKDLEPYKQIILKTIIETKELNARIYIQVLDNLVELIKNNTFSIKKYIQYLILVNINFILTHHIIKVDFEFEKSKYDPIKDIEKEVDAKFLLMKTKSEIELPIKLIEYLEKIKKDKISFLILKETISFYESQNSKGNGNYIDNTEVLNQFIDNHLNLVRSYIFISKHQDIIKFESNNEAEQQLFNEISNFIETGILI
ncbi:MAG: P-loop NTPase fold protein [Aliarcobacter sp.]|nr:P-loop NTPase fold protein [Aliarcobacter sp.]